MGIKAPTWWKFQATKAWHVVVHYSSHPLSRPFSYWSLPREKAVTELESLITRGRPVGTAAVATVAAAPTLLVRTRVEGPSFSIAYKLL